MKAIDLHSDTVLRLSENPGETLLNAKGHISLSKLIEGDVSCQCFALFTKMHELADDDGLTPFERLSHLHDVFIREVEGSDGKIKQAVSGADIAENESKGIISALLTIEGLDPLVGKLSNAEKIISWGVRIAGLTWNWENELAYPQSSDRAVMNAGLKNFGHEVIELFNEKGVIVDVSHLSDGGFRDVIDSADKVVATHSNCRAVTPDDRNLTDDMIRSLADKGGVMGLNFCPSFLTDDESHESRISDMVRHVKHMINVGGEDLPALGSDFDGIGGKLEVDGPDKFPLLYDSLHTSGLSHRVLEKMWKSNALRLL
ncbi:MAG: dipeptidase [Bullifex sp.]